jgi:hypothetical protein
MELATPVGLLYSTILGVPEYLGGQVQVEFDMPNPNDVGETSGIVIHGK